LKNNKKENISDLAGGAYHSLLGWVTALEGVV